MLKIEVPNIYNVMEILGSYYTQHINEVQIRLLLIVHGVAQCMDGRDPNLKIFKKSEK